MTQGLKGFKGAGEQMQGQAKAWMGTVAAMLTLFAGVVITAFVWRIERGDDEARLRARFEFRVDEAHAAIAMRMATHEQVLRGAAGLVSANQGVNRTQWRQYVAALNMEKAFPGFQGIGYAHCVGGADKAAFERRQQAQGLADYVIRPAGQRDRYCPVTFLEPNSERNLRAHGFDMLTEPTRQAAMARATDSGHASITGKLKLASEAQGSQVSGFLMYVPVYAPGLPVDTLEQRRAALMGFVNSPFRANDLMRGVLGDASKGLRMALFDGETASPSALMHVEPSHGESQLKRASDEGLTAGLGASRTFKTQDRAWTLSFEALPEFVDNSETAAPTIAAAIGAAMSVLMASVVWLLFSRLAMSRRAQQRLEQLAHFDTLTGLPNRAMFQQRLTAAIAQAQRDGSAMALVFVDMDNFKFVNDTEGHDAGDELIKAAALRMANNARSNDVVSRLGGDEFTVILSNMQGTDEVAMIGARLVAAMNKPFLLRGHELNCSVSLGIAMYPQDGQDSATLLRHADTAMYRAKEHGKRQFQFFAEEMNAAAARRLSIESCLRSALQQGAFELAFQPVVALEHGAGDGRLVGLEALLRLRQQDVPQGAHYSTTELVACAEQCGLITAIGDVVLSQACAQLAAWPGAVAQGIRVAVNVSARQLNDSAFAARVQSSLTASGVAAHLLELELTETALMGDAEGVIQVMQDLRRLGVSLVLDDFGTGYSSLAYLHELPIDKVKIDRSFVSVLAGADRPGAIVKAIVAIGQSMNLAVVAEGVETPAQRSALLALGCTLAQGHHYSEALSPQALAQRYPQLLQP